MKRGVLPQRVAVIAAGVLSLVTYVLTVEHGVSLWDCPEYVTTALRLEIGHPPGNPMWMLFHRVVATLAPGHEAFAINLCSALFMALGTALLCSVILAVCRIVWGSLLRRNPRSWRLCALGSWGGSMTFGWCDSAWFSAVEAEVYAMSLFLTALCVRLMIGWLALPGRRARDRRLILIAYLTGLSIGVHQLNLLCIPALALIWVYGHNRGRPCGWRAWGGIIAGCALVGVLLLGMMPLTSWWSGAVELFAANTLHLPRLSGAGASVILLMAGAWALPWLTRRYRRLSLAAWMGALTLTGYMVWLIIPIRALADPPMNQGNPSDPFAFASYLSREQYGAAPLFHGPTPYSRPLLVEEGSVLSTGDTLWRYRDFVRIPDGVRYAPRREGARVRDTFGLIERCGHGSDTAGHGYVASGMAYDLLYPPELDMWLPRITSRSPEDLPSYEAWAGMTVENMDTVEVSRTLDPAGNPAGLRGVDGSRHRPVALRPTYTQNLRYFLGYQVGYMYLRYLMWNYSGRQNDLPSTGECDHGNFITGFPIIDNAMLGPQDKLPSEARSANRGYNRYFMIPFLLGLLGCVVLCLYGRRGRRVLSVSALLWLMTGLAIVFYLNQSPGEPRERDYSFLGSYWVFSFWIGIALCVPAVASGRLGSRGTRIVAALLSILVPGWMMMENYDDHDRSGRRVTETLADNVLQTLPENAILVVQGDNFTFPLWHAQNVRGVRRDVVIVNRSYLSTPWYAAQLGRPREGGHVSPAMTGRSEDFIYGQVPFATLPDTAVEMEAAEALRMMYSDTARVPRLPSYLLRAGGKSVNLCEVLGKSPGGRLTLSEIVMTDLILTNATEESPRSVCFFPQSEGAPWREMLRAVGTADGMSVNERLRHVAAISDDYMSPEAYADPYCARMMAYERERMLDLALDLEGEGRYAEAASMAELSLHHCAPEIWPMHPVVTGGEVLYTGLETARLLLQYGDEKQRAAGRVLLEEETARHEAWERYWRAMPTWRRSAISPRSVNMAAGAPRARALRSLLH